MVLKKNALWPDVRTAQARGLTGTRPAELYEKESFPYNYRMTLAQLIQQERLPADFTTTVDRYYRPLAERVAGWSQNQPIVLGINGGQGTGKSTMAAFLKELLEDEYGKRVAVLSIDDFYLTRSERGRLAAEVHPLLATRGSAGNPRSGDGPSGHGFAVGGPA